MHCGPSRAGVADGIKGRGGRRGCIHAGQDKTGRIGVVVVGVPIKQMSMDMQYLGRR